MEKLFPKCEKPCGGYMEIGKLLTEASIRCQKLEDENTELKNMNGGFAEYSAAQALNIDLQQRIAFLRGRIKAAEKERDEFRNKLEQLIFRATCNQTKTKGEPR